MHQSMLAMLRNLAVLAVLLVVPSIAGEAPVAFQNAGGDAWTFEKLIETSVVPGRCDEVTITSPLATVTVSPQGDRALARVPLIAGANSIAAQCRKNGASIGVPAHQNWRLRLADTPKARIRAMATASGMAFDAGASELAPARPAPLARYEWRARDGNPAPLTGLPAEGKRIGVAAPARDGVYFVILRVTDRAGRSDEATSSIRMREGRWQAIDAVQERADWIELAIIYGVVPKLFGARGLTDVITKLDQIAALGVNTLWLSPVTDAPAGDFGYAVSDHFRVRASFGSEAELRALIGAAHQRGQRVLLDFVPNHVSEQHAYFADAQAYGRASPYFDFFERTAAGDVVSYFDWNNLKNLNYDNPEVQRLIIEASAYWVRAFDIDGFRVDAAWGPLERPSEVWPRWRAELKRIKPDLLLLAEASARDHYYVGHGFDAAYDWTE